MKIIEPKAYLVGCTGILDDGFAEYLRDTDNLDFWYDIDGASGLSDGEILCSFYAKLCYKSLTVGKNANITQTRGIWDNLTSCVDVGHGSVFEHCNLNFVFRSSRVQTHEHVRHRVGVAYSQESGRYCALDNIGMILPPEFLEDGPSMDIIERTMDAIEGGIAELQDRWAGEMDQSMERRKYFTSAFRRLAPDGRSNEFGWSCNIRALRHMLEMRTNRAAEWEIRCLFNQVADLVGSRWPLVLYGGQKELVNGWYEWTGLRC